MGVGGWFASMGLGDTGFAVLQTGGLVLAVAWALFYPGRDRGSGFCRNPDCWLELETHLR